MKLLLLFFSISIAVNFTTLEAHSQESPAKELHKALSKTPSYKSQIKGQKKTDYSALVERISNEYSGAKTEFEQFYLLTQLFHPLLDNHLAFHAEFTSNVLPPAFFSDFEKVKAYRSSESFMNHPRVAIDPDKLEEELNKKSFDEVEGIYFHTDSLKIGIFRTEKRDSLVGVVLDTKLLSWDRGQLFCQLMEYSPNKFRAIYFHPIYKNLSMIKTEKFLNGMLTESTFYNSLTLNPVSKKRVTPDYIYLPKETPLYIFSHLNSNTDYLRLGRFQTSTAALMESSVFYHHIKDSLQSDNLVLDLRNNGGGGFKNSEKFLKLLRKYKGEIYVLVNNRTYSNAEEFTVELQKEKKVIVLGEQTNGTLTYGSNYGRHTPIAGKFKVYLTDMKDKGGYLQYEEVGVMPEIILQKDSDWVQQTLEIISKAK